MCTLPAQIVELLLEWDVGAQDRQLAVERGVLTLSIQLLGEAGRAPDLDGPAVGKLRDGTDRTVVGEQKETNPFLRVTSLEMFLQFMGR
jgi:hypothetical protein